MKISCTKYLFVLLLCLGAPGLSLHCHAQLRTDTTVRHVADTAAAHTRRPIPDTVRTVATSPVNADSLAFALKPHPFQPNPKKAGLYSSIVPGLGQFYNRQYWKIPVVYAGLATVGYFFVTNLNQYQEYRIAYIGRINNPYPTDKYVGLYTTSQLQQLQNDYNKYLDMTVLIGTLGYAMQVLDAVTGAHLKNFDISRDISMRVRPALTPSGPGLGLVFNYK